MAEGWEVTGVKAELGSCGFDREGNLTITFTIDPANKYDVLPISDIRGRAFELSIATRSKRVFAGPDGLSEAEARRAARQIRRVQSEARADTGDEDGDTDGVIA